MNKHIFVEHYNAVDIDYESAPAEWIRGIIHQRFVVLLRGRVLAGFDLQQVSGESIQVFGKKAILHLPPPQVFKDNVSIDFDNSRILYTK